MKIEKKFLKKNHITRCGEKLNDKKYIVIKEVLNKKFELQEEYNYISSLSSQDDIYYSVHYIIGNNGEVLNIVPDDEVTYSTKNIELNYYIISIECCCKNECFSIKTIETLVELLTYLRKKYNISKANIFLDNDFTGSRNPCYYVDNRYKFLYILDKVN